MARFIFRPDSLRKSASARPPAHSYHHRPVGNIPDDAILMGVEPDDGDEAASDRMAKAGAAHKYIKREPTGDPKRKWRYYYYVPDQGVVTSDGLKEGARYAGVHNHEGVAHTGHFEVVKHHAETGHVTVRHTGSGQEQHIGHAQFAEMVNAQHAATHANRKTEKIAEIEEAIHVLKQKPGDQGQKRRVERLVHNAAQKGWLKPAEAQMLLRGHTQSRPKETQQAKTSVRQKGGVKDGGIGLRGRDETIFVADESGSPKEQHARYRLVEADELVTSHDSKTFAPAAAYPAGVQERPYDKSKFAQQEVIKHARHLEPRLVINDNPDAAHGPPIMTPKGLALGGNSRGMSLQIAYRVRKRINQIEDFTV